MSDSLPHKLPSVQHPETGERMDEAEAEASSDFDDEDFDIGMIEALSGVVKENPAVCLHQELHFGSANEIPRSPKEVEADSESTSVQKSKPVLSTTTQHICETERQSPAVAAHVDEFDNDDEVEAAELEGIFAVLDTQESPQRLLEPGIKTEAKGIVGRVNNTNDAQTILNKSEIAIEINSEEEDFFDGDSDFEKIAAEVSTSQIQGELLHAKVSVCNFHNEPSI